MEQSTNYLPHIIVGLVALIIGWIIGFFDSNLRTSKKIKQAETSAEIAIKDAKDKIMQAEARLSSTPAMPIVMDDPGILRVKNENGTLSLQVDGAQVDSLSLAPMQRKRLIEILNLVRPWLDGKPAPVVPLPPTQSSDPLDRLDAVSASPQTYRTPAPVQSAQPAPKPATPKKDDKPEPPPNSMVAQINAILQLRIANTSLAAQGVTLLESPSGGVNVYIGIKKYEGVEDVPSEEIKAAIRYAIAEWEKKYTPGL